MKRSLPTPFHRPGEHANADLREMDAGTLAVELAHLDARICRIWDETRRLCELSDRLAAREREARREYARATKEAAAGQQALGLETV